MEAFMVYMDIAGLPQVLYIQDNKLVKRKCKVADISPKESENIHPDTIQFPVITRNVSESQLLSLKSAGKVKKICI